MNAFYVCGPTASGKSTVALWLAREFDGEIVNADAFQLYQGLPTLTAAPTPGEQGGIPHHLYQILPPSERFDAARYRAMARPILEEVRSRGKLPVVVGGSGLYLKFLTHGPSELPPGDPALRRELEALPLEELNRRLADRDPGAAERIDPQNPRYVVRALEICLLTGRPVSELRQSFQTVPPALIGFALHWSPGELELRIRNRTKRMLAAGAVEEVAALPADAAGAAKAIGVAEIRALLAGELSRKECEERLVIATRQYAKRQRTWFRREAWLTRLPGPHSREDTIAAARQLLGL